VPVSKEAAEVLRKEALRAFREIGDALMNGETDAFLSRVLDDGRPADAAALRRLPELERDLRRTRDLLRAARADAPEPRNFHVEVRRTAAPGGAEGGDVSLSFDLPGTQELGRRLPSAPGKPPVASDDGTLVVRMKRVGTRWYWAPFGW